MNVFKAQRCPVLSRKRASVGGGFRSNQAKAKSVSIERQAQLIKQVETGMALAWLE